MVLSAVLGTGEAFFTPALGGLTPAITPGDKLGDANALLGIAQSAAKVIGPALSGVLIGFTQPGLVIAIDAATFGVSLFSLTLLRVPAISPPTRSPWHDFIEGWRQFRAQTWLGVITVQFALFNLLTWAPFLLLGPLLAREYLGGARAWGTITADGSRLGAYRPGAGRPKAAPTARCRGHRQLLVRRALPNAQPAPSSLRGGGRCVCGRRGISDLQHLLRDRPAATGAARGAGPRDSL
ncbi:MAG TPA: MFS transporter [Streptosporangiaceae bacterium]|nr:MFS transporter [Streptosporangiaceae bacterium]